jgi:hypothetical protein
MTKTDTTTYYYDLDVPVGDFTATCSVTIAQDLAGNAITAAPTNATFTVDNTVPTILSAVRGSNTQLTVTLSQLALASTITKANDGGFIVYETGTPETTYAVSNIAPGATDDLVVLTVANMLVSGKEGVTVTYATGGNGTVSDVAGNALATDAVGVAVTAWDTAAPTLASASRSSNTHIFVTLSENADDATLTQANDGGFVVFETGTPATAYAVSATAKQGSNSNIVDITVADITASAAVGITVTYSSAGNGIITDVAGNEMATNETGVTFAAWA